MKPNRLFVLAATLLSLLTDVRAQNESLASIFTNADTRVIPGRRTSIIYIQCHGLGYGDLSCYGQTNFQTPNLDKLAAEGVRFTNFRPGGTNFSTSLAALMSGKKSGRMGAPTVAERLQAAGYATGLIGEWTLGEKPWTQGFDEFAGFIRDEEGRNYFADHVWRFAPKAVINTNNVQEDWVGSEMIYENIDGKKGRYLPEVLVNAMCSFIGIHKSDPFNDYKPFFLMVNLPSPRRAMRRSQASAGRKPRRIAPHSSRGSMAALVGCLKNSRSWASPTTSRFFSAAAPLRKNLRMRK
jgi:Sulfatase